MNENALQTLEPAEIRTMLLKHMIFFIIPAFKNALGKGEMEFILSQFLPKPI